MSMVRDHSDFSSAGAVFLVKNPSIDTVGESCFFTVSTDIPAIIFFWEDYFVANYSQGEMDRHLSHLDRTLTMDQRSQSMDEPRICWCCFQEHEQKAAEHAQIETNAEEHLIRWGDEETGGSLSEEGTS